MSQHRSKHFVLALLAGLTLSVAPSMAGSGIHAAAASPQPYPQHEGPRPIMKEGADRIRSLDPGSVTRPAAGDGGVGSKEPTGGPRIREVFGFTYIDALYTATGVDSWDWSQLSTVAVFGLYVNWDGHLIHDGSWNLWHNPAYTQHLFDKAHAAGTRVVLTVIAQSFDNDPHGWFCGALENNATTAGDAAAEAAFAHADGVNIDYEGFEGICGDAGVHKSTLVTQMAQRTRAALPGGSYLSIDTYGSSAGDPGGFFNIRDLNSWVDSFMVMAYDMNYANTPGNMSPTAPVYGYLYNQSREANEYAAAVGGGKTLMGVPYYGIKSCVSAPVVPNAHANTPIVAEAYWSEVTNPGDPHLHNYTIHHDALDSYIERWDTYDSDYAGCLREHYWDDAASLADHYDNVNNKNLRGVGIWTLNYGGGEPSLWNTIKVKLAGVPSAPTGVTTCPGDGFASVTWTPPALGQPIFYNTAVADPLHWQTVFGNATSAVVRNLTNGTPYPLTVTSINTNGSGVTSDPSLVTPVPPPGSWPGQYHPLAAPARLLDTRQGIGPLGPGSVFTLSPLGQGGLPATGVAGLIVNVTVTEPGQAGYFTVYPSGTCRPLASTLNFSPRQTAANLSETSLGADGRIAVFNGSSLWSHLIIDVFGYISGAPASGNDGRVRPVGPVRIADSRSGLGAVHRFGPNEAQLLTVPGGDIPAHAEAVVLNLTATNGSAGSYFSVVPAGQPPNQISSLNFAPGETRANRVYAPLGPDGKISIYNNSGSADFVVDVTAWISGPSTPPQGGGFYTGVTPVRILDTRTSGTGPLGPGWRIQVAIAGQPGLPSAGVSVVVLNLTVSDPNAGSYFAVTPTSSGATGTSDLNFGPGPPEANLVVAPVGPDGSIYIYNRNGWANAIVDLVGYH